VIRTRRFDNGVSKLELIISKPTLTLVGYFNDEGYQVDPRRIGKLYRLSKLPTMYRKLKIKGKIF